MLHTATMGIYTYIVDSISFMFGFEILRLLKNSGTCVRIVKYISNFLLHFSRENLHPRRNVISKLSSSSEKKQFL